MSDPQDGSEVRTIENWVYYSTQSLPAPIWHLLDLLVGPSQRPSLGPAWATIWDQLGDPHFGTIPHDGDSRYYP